MNRRWPRCAATASPTACRLRPAWPVRRRSRRGRWASTVRGEPGAALARRAGARAVACGHAAAGASRRRDCRRADRGGHWGRESNVLHAAAGKVPREYMMRARDYDDASWQQHERALAERGLLDDTGALTAAGARLKEHIEFTTDRLALSALERSTTTTSKAVSGAHTHHAARHRGRGYPGDDADGTGPRRSRRWQRAVDRSFTSSGRGQFISESRHAVSPIAPVPHPT